MQSLIYLKNKPISNEINVQCDPIKGMKSTLKNMPVKYKCN